MCSAVAPVLFCALMSALCLVSSFTKSMCPFCAAACVGGVVVWVQHGVSGGSGQLTRGMGVCGRVHLVSVRSCAPRECAGSALIDPAATATEACVVAKHSGSPAEHAHQLDQPHHGPAEHSHQFDQPHHGWLWT